MKNEEQHPVHASYLRELKVKLPSSIKNLTPSITSCYLKWRIIKFFSLTNGKFHQTNKFGYDNFFRQQLRQHITPILITPETDLVEFLKDDYTYLAVEIIQGQHIQYALLKFQPANSLDLFTYRLKCRNAGNQ